MERRLKAVFDTLNRYAEAGENVPIKEAAEICGCTVETLRNGIRKGSVPFAFECGSERASRGYYIISPAALWRWYSGGEGPREGTDI